MKLSLIVLSLAAYVTASTIPNYVPEYNTAYGYLSRFGIPAAERLQKAEEEYLKNPASRITNGSPAALGQFKYQAGLIGEIVGITGRSICGGVLVSNNRVLTAAHCWNDGVNQVWRLTVVLGSVLLFSGGTRVQSSDVAVHPRWFPLLIRNDIAVVRLTDRVSPSATIGPIALPTGSQINEHFSGEQAVASGFGLLGDNATITNDQFLSYGSMTVLENSRCLSAFPDIVFQDSNLCARTLGSASTCRGDSGGPLAVLRNDAPLLVGLTSFGLRWCELGYPAAFVRVTSFMDFINWHLLF